MEKQERDYATTPNEVFLAGVNELVNAWFKRFRDMDMTGADWDACVKELNEISKKHNSRLIDRIGIALLEELERRDIQKRKRR